MAHETAEYFRKVTAENYLAGKKGEIINYAYKLIDSASKEGELEVYLDVNKEEYTKYLDFVISFFTRKGFKVKECPEKVNNIHISWQFVSDSVVDDQRNFSTNIDAIRK